MTYNVFGGTLNPTLYYYYAAYVRVRVCFCLCSERLKSTSQLYDQVCGAYERLSLAADDRATKLERCLQLRQFEDRASTVAFSYFITVTPMHITHYRQDLPQAALPVFRLLTGRFWGFSPRRGDTLHRSRSNLAGRSGP